MTAWDWNCTTTKLIHKTVCIYDYTRGFIQFMSVFVWNLSTHININTKNKLTIIKKKQTRKIE